VAFLKHFQITPAPPIILFLERREG
jgi:hypothetical protein